MMQAPDFLYRVYKILYTTMISVSIMTDTMLKHGLKYGEFDKTKFQK